ncbi:MAG TPA: acetate--CoA ligase [Chloroflexota bacterium]|nr:acetate--CoA ligase [Chloroflexota bacterium]
MTMDNSGTIDALLQEDRRYEPTDEFRRQANWSDPSIYERADADFEGFWAQIARDHLDWFKPFTQVLEWDAPWVKWFADGELNISYNCVDRHAQGSRGEKPAIIWEGEPGDVRTLTYSDLYREVNACAAALKKLGVGKGDRVAIYMGMVPEAAIAMLACTRIGAPHTVVFGGFSPDALAGRIQDCEAKLVITQDAGWRRGGQVPLKANTDEAVKDCPTIEHVLVVKRVGDAANIEWHAGRDVWWHEVIGAEQGQEVAPEHLPAEHPLFILYTSGTTGKPKGVLHTTAGYLTGVTATTKYIFDLKENDVYWCTADIGWVTGHSYIVYGPLSNGATAIIFEGTPDYPDKDRWWEIVEKYKISILYTAPTAIRTMMRWGTEYPEKHDLSSLRLMGTVGEPINPEAWVWYREHIGGDRTPVVDTWWQTETGSILITPLPGITTLKPGSATTPFPGVGAEVVNEQGEAVPYGAGGYLILTRPWPSMMRTIWGDDERYKQQYWSRFPGVYFTGDGARRDEDGYLWLLGRVDDVLNIAGHRIGTMEVESALVSHPSVAEAAAIGIGHEIKGQALAVFVTPRGGVAGDEALQNELRAHVSEKIGAIARPDKIYFTAELPKTRSAKIMRRLLRDIAEGRVVGDTTTLADPGVLASIKAQYEDSEG